MTNGVDQTIALLQSLIRCPSPSGHEAATADLLAAFLKSHGCTVERRNHNVVSRYQGSAPTSPYLLLCSHHDTVKPNSGYTRDPYDGVIADGRLYGLGSNDAGASLVSLIAAFLEVAQQERPVNIMLALVAEEETSGPNGVSCLLHDMPDVALAIVGEPTQCRMAVAEKGLLVLDGLSTGIPGHAAHTNTRNPIVQACTDMLAIQHFTFDRISTLLGSTRANVTAVHAGNAHNQVPAECRFVVDIRVNELYDLQEIVTLLQAQVASTLTARSLRLRPSGLPNGHWAWQLAADLGIDTFGSPTISDQALLPYPSIKIGPGDSLRSHTADEYVELHEIEQGISIYSNLIDQAANHLLP